MTKETSKFKYKPSDLERKEFDGNEFVLYVPSQTDIDEAISPEAFSSISGEFRPWDVIELRWEDMSKKAIVTVRDSNKYSAIVSIDAVYEYSGKDTALINVSPLEVKYAGKATKYGVFRKSDGSLTAGGYTTREMAESEMQNQLKAM